MIETLAEGICSTLCIDQGRRRRKQQRTEERGKSIKIKKLINSPVINSGSTAETKPKREKKPRGGESALFKDSVGRGRIIFKPKPAEQRRKVQHKETGSNAVLPNREGR